MGREIRKVPKNWDHPKSERYPERYQPLLDIYYPDASKKWMDNAVLWSKGIHPNQVDYCDYYWEYESVPDHEYCRNYKDEDAVWFQVYETVSEGTPVTPPFETEAELVDYLVENGDFWDQRRGDGPWSMENAESFIGVGFALSAVISNGVMLAPKDGQFK